MCVGELLYPGWCLCDLRLGLVRVGGAGDQSTCLGLAEMQHDVSRYLIGSVFLASQHRHPQHIEHGVGEFMEGGLEQGAYQSVDRRDAILCRRLGHGLPDRVYIFVANDYYVFVI